MPKGVYDRKRPKLSKEELKRRDREHRRKYQKKYFTSLSVDDIRSVPTLDRNSVHVGFDGDFNLRIDVRVGPRLNEERHGFNWRYWNNGND